MAKFSKKQKWVSTIYFNEFPGVVSCVVNKRKDYFWPVIRTPEVKDERKRGVQELADGLRMMARHASKVTGRGLPRRGMPVDPNEGDAGFVLAIFPADPTRYRLIVTRDPDSGMVEADIPDMEFDDDLPGVVQACTVLEQCAALMKAYEPRILKR